MNFNRGIYPLETKKFHPGMHILSLFTDSSDTWGDLDWPQQEGNQMRAHQHIWHSTEQHTSSPFLTRMSFLLNYIFTTKQIFFLSYAYSFFFFLKRMETEVLKNYYLEAVAVSKLLIPGS